MLANAQSPIPEHTPAQCLHRLFEDQAERTPNALALAAHDGQFTYVEVNRRANQLAHHLRTFGIGPEIRAGIALPRSAEMIVAALAVLKAGGTYVPIDPAYPPRRSRYLAEDSGISILLTHRAVPEGLNAQSIRTIPLESYWSGIAQAPDHAPDCGTGGSNLAYVVYTSGSTGKPKGVMVTHENVVRSTEARDRYYALKPDRFLLLSSFSFDSSVAGIFWTLLNGGELWLPPEGTQQNVARIAELIRHGGITHLLALPSLYRSLLLQAAHDELRSLRTVIVAGEPCPVDLAAMHFRHLPEVSLFNEYGPTEATVWCTAYDVKPGFQSATVPIGKPAANVEAWILDAEMRPVPSTVAGELYIGGPQLARGYLGRPDFTAEKFPPHPLSTSPGERLYRTGDLARYCADGNIEFLGRADQQVKIRGYRIELGEIESALREHPQVRDAAVAGKRDGEGHQRLVAYVVPVTGQIDTALLRQFLRQSLPEYMTPAAYVTLDALPINANGKLDRQALPDPKPAESQNNYVAPRTEVEQRLAQIWTELLGVRRVGIHDDFFELGGDSILGMQMATLANQAGILLKITQLGEQPTIARLAAACRPAEPAMEPAEQS